MRQVYYSLVLSRWFKERYRSQSIENRAQIKEKANNYLSLIDSGDLTNLASKESYDKQTYFQAYQKSFKGGEYNLKETVATPSGQSIRSYISGGIITEIKNMSIVGSPVREDVTKALKIGLVGDPSLISTGSPLGEKLIEDDDRYGNIRYVEYEKLSDLSRAYLWNSFQSVTSYVQYDPEYNWGFAIELNKRGGIGRVMGAVKYKKNTETVPLLMC